MREWTLEVISEVCENYDVDGIQLDYIRFPLPTYYDAANYEDFGYNAGTVSAFTKKYGASADPVKMSITDPLWEKWCQFRCDIITSFLSEVSTLVRGKGLPISCTCFASADDRKKFVFQDVKKWADEGLIDAIYPMIYSATLEGEKQYGDEMKLLVGDRCAIILGIGTYDGETNEVISDQIAYSHSLGTEGCSIFALQYIQIFGFDPLYGECLYRTPAVRTDSYGEAVSGYADMLLFLLDKTCSYKYGGDYTLLKAELEKIKTEYGGFDPEGRSVSERKKYLTDAKNAFSSLKKLSSADEDIAAMFASYVDKIASSLERVNAGNR